MNIVALAGGVGGAKLADGLAKIIPSENLTIIVNTGDDFEHLGLKICPDIDTVCYTLAGLANPVTGWGRADESWQAFDALAALEGPAWFRLGDKDLATHLERTRRLQAGQPLSQIVRDFCASWGIRVKVLPATDDPVPTIVLTPHGELSFQEYFVKLKCEPRVTGFRFEKIAQARPAPGVMDALSKADLILINPSNPWVSINPILEIPGVRDLIATKPVLAVSPIIGGQAVKGPAAKMYSELGVEPSALAVAEHYGSLLSGFVMDQVDADQVAAVRALGIAPYTTTTWMKSPDDRAELAQTVITYAKELLTRRPIR